MKYQHRLVRDDEGWYECSACKRVSKDPTLLDSLSCTTDAPADATDVTIDWTAWKMEQVASTVALDDARLNDMGPAQEDFFKHIQSQLQDGLRKQAQKDHLYIDRYGDIEQHPMTTMPGYTIFKMKAEAVHMKPIVLTRTIKVTTMDASRYFAPRSAGKVPNPLDGIFGLEIKEATRERNVLKVGVDYELLFRDEVHETWQATVWTRPSRTSPITPLFT